MQEFEIEFIPTIDEFEIDISDKVKEVFPPLVDLEITSSMEEQIFNHEDSYGYDKIKVHPIVIRLQEKEVIPNKEVQEVFPDSGYNGLSKVILNAISLQNKNVSPSKAEQIITADEDYIGLEKVTIKPVDNTIDSNIVSENIRNGIDILGVKGNFTGNKYSPKYISFYQCKEKDLSEEIKNLDTSKVTNMGYMFSGCTSLTSADLSNFDTSNVTNMLSMFYNCQSLRSVDLSSFDTSNVTNMGSMFYNCYVLSNLDLSNFDTSNVNSFYYLFSSCYALKSVNLSSFNTSKVTSMSNMFYYCQSLESVDVSNFDTSNVTNMDGMFYNCSSLTSLDLSNFVSSPSISIRQMFYNCRKLSRIDMRSFAFTNMTNSNKWSGMLSSVPVNCLIIVKDNAEKEWFNTNFSAYTNVKTVEELDV